MVFHNATIDPQLLLLREQTYYKGEVSGILGNGITSKEKPQDDKASYNRHGSREINVRHGALHFRAHSCE
jgi:hypothetical protein